MSENYDIENFDEFDDAVMPDINELVAQATKVLTPEEIDHNILDNLNPEQRQAAMIINGPLRILAGAGTGKTKTVTHRIAYMINHGVNPANILAITFTNKAAREFHERLAYLLPAGQAISVTCGTIHGIFARLLREYAEHIDYTESYAILDDKDSEHLLKVLTAETVYGDAEAKVDKDIFSQICNDVWNIKSDVNYPNELDELLAHNDITYDGMRVYTAYQNYLTSHNMMDFDDLLLNMYKLLSEHPDVLDELQDRFTHIIVDEYQDTSTVQDLSIKLLAKKHRNLCVIGDDDQSIYAWRNADPKLMLEFTQVFPETTDVTLEENYRSSNIILTAANQVIANNLVRLKKSLWTNSPENEPIHYKACANSYKQAEYVVQQVEKYHNAGIPYKQMAVLYRQNNSSGFIEKELSKHNIPYELYRGTAFFKHESVKDMISYAQLLISNGPESDLALQRIVNKPARGFSDAIVSNVETSANALGLSLMQTIEKLAQASTEPKIKKLSANFVNVFSSAKAALQSNQNIGDIISLLFTDSGYSADLVNKKSRHESKKQEKDIADEANINTVIEIAHEFDKLHRGDPSQPDKTDNSVDMLRMFLEYAALATDPSHTSDDSVQLLTMHTSKGLEFKVVFAIDLCEGTIPSARDEDINNEEERRLMYVTITRAKKYLHLSFPLNKFEYGKTRSTNRSPFINEIDPKLMIRD